MHIVVKKNAHSLRVLYPYAGKIEKAIITPQLCYMLKYGTQDFDQYWSQRGMLRSEIDEIRRAPGGKVRQVLRPLAFAGAYPARKYKLVEKFSFVVNRRWVHFSMLTELGEAIFKALPSELPTISHTAPLTRAQLGALKSLSWASVSRAYSCGEQRDVEARWYTLVSRSTALNLLCRGFVDLGISGGMASVLKSRFRPHLESTFYERIDEKVYRLTVLGALMAQA